MAESDWRLDDIYTKSFQIVKKHKVLWIFGSALVSFGAMKAQSNFSGNNNFSKLLQQAPGKENSTEINQVLGAATNSPDFLSSFLGQIFSSIPAAAYLALGLDFLLLIALGIVIAVVAKAWITGSLIQGINLASQNKNVSIAESSKLSFSVLKPLIILQIVPGLIFGLIIATIAIIITVGLVAGGLPIKILFGFLAFGGIIALIIAGLLFTMTMIWAERKVILDGFSASEAFWSGFKIAKKKFWASILLGLVNTILSMLIEFGVLAVLIASIIGPVVGGIFTIQHNLGVGMFLFALAGLLIAVFSVGGLLVSGIISAFKATTWTLAYNSIKDKYDTK